MLFRSPTYADGTVGAIYGWKPPLVNSSRQPGEWQSYDIVYHRPHFDAAGKVLSPARFTVFHNGVLIQNQVQLKGETLYIGTPQYKAYDRAPIKLQAHGDPSPPPSFRNIWVRETNPL